MENVPWIWILFIAAIQKARQNERPRIFIQNTNWGWLQIQKFHNSFKKDILEHFKNMDKSQGSKKCMYNWVGGPAININWLNSSITFFQWTRIYSWLFSGKEENGPQFEIHFLLDPYFVHIKFDIYWRRGEK